jgi:hypothetical protein
MLDRYINVNNKKISAGQNSQGFWFCKEIIAENTKELKELITEINKILNEFNKEK